MNASTRQVSGPRLLSRFVPVNALSDAHLEALAGQAEFLDFAAGARLPIRESFPERTLYLVEGEIEVLADGKRIDTIRAGSEAARFSLAHVETQRRTARALTPVTLVRIERAQISTLLVWAQAPESGSAPGGEASSAGDPGLSTSLLRSAMFTRIPAANVQRIHTRLEEVRVRAGDVVVRQGEPGDYYYVIRDGRCAVTHGLGEGAQAVELARLGPGDCFGEEALISDARRNASVSMMTDGALLRLTKNDFVELVRDPLLSLVSRQRADALVAAGARWLDVRLTEEHANGAIAGSLNVPLATLRERADSLEPSATWVAYCNTGKRSSAAAFLLVERGIKAHVLKGGLEASATSGAPEVESDPSPADLQAQLLMANADLEDAVRAKAQADVARALDGEDDADDADDGASAIVAERRERLEAHAAAAGAALVAAKERKLVLERSRRANEAQAADEREAIEAEVARRRAAAEAHLRAEQERLEAEYGDAAARIETIERGRQEAEARYQAERERLEAEFAKARREMDEAMHRAREDMQTAREKTEAKATQILTEHEHDADRLRAELEARLRADRARLEAEVALTVAAEARALEILESTEDARLAAEREGQRLAERIREAEERRRAEAENRLAAERERLEQATVAARARLDEARRALDGRNAKPAPRKAESASVARAAEQVREAEHARAEADLALERTERRHAAERAREGELRGQLLDEMEAWLDESRESADDAERLARVEKEAARRTAEARGRSAQAASDLLSEVEAQLGGDGPAGPAPTPAPTPTPTPAGPESAAARFAREARERARAQIEALRRKGVKDED